MIECVNPLSDHRWETAVATLPGATFFHRTAWARVLHDTYGFSPCYFLSPSSDAQVSALPVMGIDSWLTGKRGAALPFTDECEPLIPDPDSFSAAFKELISFGKERRWRSLEIRGGHHWATTVAPSVSFLGHRLELTSDSAALFNHLDSSVRRAVRKAEQSGLEIEFSQSLDSVRDFYRLLGKTRQRHGVPPQPFRFFERIHRHVLEPGHGWVVLARVGKLPVAGAVFLHSGRSAIYKFGGSDDAYQSLRANNLVMWHALEWYASHGFASMDFGRTSLGNEGLRRFKLSWGTSERAINYYKYDLRTNAFVTVHDQASGWHSRVFRALPRSVSQWIGTALYKHIA